MTDRVFEEAGEWKKLLQNIEKPWLCWCTEDEWCLAQQKSVKKTGWTPVVGVDRVGKKPTLEKGSVFIDFNKNFQFQQMWPLFPVEFVFLFAEKMAFWHSDVLLPQKKMEKIARKFETLKPGECASEASSWTTTYRKAILEGKPINYYSRKWEIIGCTTAVASKNQYECGCGWWRNVERHPNATKKIKKMKPWYDHGKGIWLWEKYFGGKFIKITIDKKKYHFSTCSPLYRKLYKKKRNKKETMENFLLKKAAKKAGLEI